LIEDAAQVMGGSYKGKKCCSFGDIACTSFFPSKPLGCYGDGGAVFTDDDEYAAIMESIKVHGKGTSKYDNVRIGMNSRLDTIQAAILLAKMNVLDEEIQKRQVIAEMYNRALEEVVYVPKIDKKNVCSYAQYCILLGSMEERNLVITALGERNIPSLIYYPNPLHSLVAFDKVSIFNREKFGNSWKYAQCNLGLPFSPYLKEEDQNLVIQTIIKCLTSNKIDK
jgi:dTDP-4-amino-4,6-dideoxygalactose transaminase